MKKIILLAILLVLCSCQPTHQHKNIEIEYQDGTKVVLYDLSYQYIYLDEGCIRGISYEACYVKTFKLLN